MLNNSVIFVIGVSGSGKTTIGKLLSEEIGSPFFDADDFHSDLNKDKMNRGQPLTDEDRKEWLHKMNEVAKTQMKRGGAIIACSALKEKYRLILSDGITLPIFWIFLRGGYELIAQRILARKDHYMPAALLASQFEILEEPQNAIVVDISEQPEQIIQIIMPNLKS